MANFIVISEINFPYKRFENLKLAEDLTKTCFEMYAVTSTGLAPEIAYFHTEVSGFLWHFGFHQLIKDHKKKIKNAAMHLIIY